MILELNSGVPERQWLVTVILPLSKKNSCGILSFDSSHVMALWGIYIFNLTVILSRIMLQLANDSS